MENRTLQIEDIQHYPIGENGLKMIFEGQGGRIITLKGFTSTSLGDTITGGYEGFDVEKGLPRASSGKEILDILGYPLNLDLILLALEKKGCGYISFEKKSNLLWFRHNDRSTCVGYTPLQPIPEETITALLEILK